MNCVKLIVGYESEPVTVIAKAWPIGVKRTPTGIHNTHSDNTSVVYLATIADADGWYVTDHGVAADRGRICACLHATAKKM